jgi:hypothetical protein
MHIVNSNPANKPVETYNVSSPKQKDDKMEFLSQLANNDGSQGAQVAKSVLMNDPMFMAGTGIRSLGYIFLLFQIFSNLEIRLLESGVEQAKVSNAMYHQLKEIEFAIAKDVWLSGLAKGISQITGAVAQLGISAYSAKAQRSALNKNEVTVTGTPKRPNSPTNRQPSVNDDSSASVQGVVSSDSIQAAQASQQPNVNTQGNLGSSAGTPTSGQQHSPKNPPLSKEKQQEVNAIAEKYTLLGRALHDMSIGAGSVGGGWYDAEAKKKKD